MNCKTSQSLLRQRKQFYLHNFYKNIPNKQIYELRTHEQKQFIEQTGNPNYLDADFETDKTLLMLGLLMSDIRNIKYDEDSLLEFAQKQIRKEDRVVDMADAGMLDLDDPDDKRANTSSFSNLI